MSPYGSMIIRLADDDRALARDALRGLKRRSHAVVIAIRPNESPVDPDPGRLRLGRRGRGHDPTFRSPWPLDRLPDPVDGVVEAVFAERLVLDVLEELAHLVELASARAPSSRQGTRPCPRAPRALRTCARTPRACARAARRPARRSSFAVTARTYSVISRPRWCCAMSVSTMRRSGPPASSTRGRCGPPRAASRGSPRRSCASAWRLSEARRAGRRAASLRSRVAASR